MDYVNTKNYTYNDMVYLDENIKFGVKDFSLVRDFVIKEILSKNKDIYKEILILLIRSVVKLDKNKTNITLENVELGKSNYKEYNKIIDSYIVLNNKIHVDVEYNTSPYKNTKLRNILYLNKMSTKVLESGNKQNKLNEIYLIQININTSKYDNKFGNDVYYYFGKKMCKKLTDFQHILVFNIEYYRNLFYNYDVKLKKYQMWLVVFSSRNFKELYNTLNYVVKDSVRDKLIRDVIDMFSDGFRLCDWEKEKLVELVRQTELDYAREDAKLEGRKEGIQETIINTIKSMLSKNFSFKVISEITGKSIEEIKEIQNSMI